MQPAPLWRRATGDEGRMHRACSKAPESEANWEHWRRIWKERSFLVAIGFMVEKDLHTAYAWSTICALIMAWQFEEAEEMCCLRLVISGQCLCIGCQLTKLTNISSAQKEKTPGVAGSAMQHVLESPTLTMILFQQQFLKWWTCLGKAVCDESAPEMHASSSECKWFLQWHGTAPVSQKRVCLRRNSEDSSGTPCGETQWWCCETSRGGAWDGLHCWWKRGL